MDSKEVIEIISVLVKLFLMYSWIKSITKTSISQWILNYKKETFISIFCWFILSAIGCLVINYVINLLFKFLGGM